MGASTGFSRRLTVDRVEQKGAAYRRPRGHRLPRDVPAGPIESSDDDVPRRVAQAACDSDTSGSDHAVDDEDDSDSEVSMRCEFVDSMASESCTLQSDEGAGHQRGLGSLRNGLVACSLIEAFANQTWCQIDQRRMVVLTIDLIPSDAE